MLSSFPDNDEKSLKQKDWENKLLQVSPSQEILHSTQRAPLPCRWWGERPWDPHDKCTNRP
jgi:hypothetical protein